MGINSGDTYFQLLHDLDSYFCTSIPQTVQDFVTASLYQTYIQNKYSKPMMLIGIYIAIASLFCILPMLADLLHGFRTKKLWFPCKYFTLNAATLTIIAVAMKPPMDLNISMPHVVDQAAKLGSMAFMCTMMANLLPSLATMDTMELFTNIITLGVLVITMVVNVCIQIETGVVSHDDGEFSIILTYYNWLIAIFYVAMLLALLMIHTCSALMILKSKEILDYKYKAGHETALKDIVMQQLTVDKLKQHVSNHWIMAEIGSPQFMTVCSATTAASGVTCVSSTVLHGIIMLYTAQHMKDYGSEYKWSVLMILITQFIGVLLGTIAPFSRCFAFLSFKVSIKLIWKHIRVFKVESYYTQKLSDWKQSSVPFKFSSHRWKIVIQDLKVVTLSCCIGFQKMTVVACNMAMLFPTFIVIGVLCYLQCWKRSKVKFGASNNALVERAAQLQHNKDLSQYVLHLQDDMELVERTLTSISNSMTRLIQRAEKQQHNNLMKLLEESSGFEGIGKYNMYQVPPLPEEKYVDYWSLPMVTLTAIAISLPNIQKDIVARLLRSVSEGLTFNATDEYVSNQKEARTLWLEVEVYHKWLGYKLQNRSHQLNIREIVQWLSDTSKNMITEVESKHMKGSDDSSVYMSASANSMYWITQMILVSQHANIDQVSQEELFSQLASMISNILAACLINLPQVIAMICQTSVIEKREASVQTAAQLLGETMETINSLQDHELPSLNLDELSFIDKSRECFFASISLKTVVSNPKRKTNFVL